MHSNELLFRKLFIWQHCLGGGLILFDELKEQSCSQVLIFETVSEAIAGENILRVNSRLPSAHCNFSDHRGGTKKCGWIPSKWKRQQLRKVKAPTGSVVNKSSGHGKLNSVLGGLPASRQLWAQLSHSLFHPCDIFISWKGCFKEFVKLYFVLLTFSAN